MREKYVQMAWFVLGSHSGHFLGIFVRCAKRFFFGVRIYLEFWKWILVSLLELYTCILLSVWNGLLNWFGVVIFFFLFFCCFLIFKMFILHGWDYCNCFNFCIFFISIKLNQTALGIAQQSSSPGEGYFQVFLSRNKYSLPEN